MNETLEPLDMARVCNDLFVRLLESTNGRIELGKLTYSESILVLVWHVNGLIGNMGLANTLEVDVPGDLNYSKTLNALNTIKAYESFHAVREAVGICRSSTGAKINWRAQQKKCQQLEDLEEKYFESENTLIVRLYDFILDKGLVLPPKF